MEEAPAANGVKPDAYDGPSSAASGVVDSMRHKDRRKGVPPTVAGIESTGDSTPVAATANGTEDVGQTSPPAAEAVLAPLVPPVQPTAAPPAASDDDEKRWSEPFLRSVLQARLDFSIFRGLFVYIVLMSAAGHAR